MACIGISKWTEEIKIHTFFILRWLGVSAVFFELSSEFEAYLLYSEKLNSDVCKSHPCVSVKFGQHSPPPASASNSSFYCCLQLAKQCTLHTSHLMFGKHSNTKVINARQDPGIKTIALLPNHHNGTLLSLLQAMEQPVSASFWMSFLAGRNMDF